MSLGAGMAGNQADDAFDLRRVVADAGVDPAVAEPIEPQYPIGVHHDLDHGGVGQRSEEHTSELQSLMRISYAVFCLKKKNMHRHKTSITHSTEKTTHLTSCRSHTTQHATTS